MKVTPITHVYKPKFNVKKEPVQVRKILDPVRVDFVETEELPLPPVWQNDDRQMYWGIAKMVAFVGALFLLAMWLLAKGVI